MKRKRVGPAGDVIVLDVDEEEDLGRWGLQVVSREMGEVRPRPLPGG
jgi:hypothetical protein